MVQKARAVISPIVFHAGLEHAMRKWKVKLFHHGVQLGHGNRLTNIRYADNRSNDFTYMLEPLVPELAVSGLQRHHSLHVPSVSFLVFFFRVPFSLSWSVVKDCFTGQSPGKAISARGAKGTVVLGSHFLSLCAEPERLRCIAFI